jgi:hypothetical protein
MRGRVRAALAALITAATLTATACGQQEGQTVRAPSPTAEAPTAARAVEAAQPAELAPLRADYDDLVAALPPVAELAPWQLHTQCVVRTFDCAKADGSRIAMFTVDGRESVGWRETTWVAAQRFTSDRAADRWMRGRQRELTEQVRGRIDVAHTEADDRGHYWLGVRGRGALAVTSLGGWQGFRASARVRYERSDGQLTGAVRYVQVIVRRERYVVQANVKMLMPPRAEPASALAQRLVTEVVDHLETRSGT